MSRRRRRLQLIRQTGGFTPAQDAELPVPVAEQHPGRGVGRDCVPAAIREEAGELASPAGCAPPSDRVGVRPSHAGAEQAHGQANRPDERA